MEPMEPVVYMKILVPMHCFLYPCRDPGTVFREINIIEPLDKLRKLVDDWNDLVVWSGIEKVAECLQDEFL